MLRASVGLGLSFEGTVLASDDKREIAVLHSET
jgi:hypothetical protein